MADFFYPTPGASNNGPGTNSNQHPNTANTYQYTNTQTRTDKEWEVLNGEDFRKNRAPEDTYNPNDNKTVASFLNDDNTSRFGLSEELMSKHLLMLGGIGSGKSNAIYHILQGLFRRHSQNDLILIFDSKGDFYDEFYNPYDPNHIVVGNHYKYYDRSHRWCIFDELRNAYGSFDKTSELAAKEIAKILFSGRESTHQPFFSLAATDVVAKVLIHFYKNRPNELTNEALVKFFNEATAKTYHEMINANPEFESARDYFGNPDKLTAQALGVLSYITTMVNDFFVGVFKEDPNNPNNHAEPFYRNGTFSMRDLVRNKRGRVVFIEYDLSTGEVMGPIYGLLYDLALKEALGGRDHNGNVFFICDELRILPKLSHLNDGLNLGRSLGVKIVAAIQTINQLYDVYGPELGKTIAAGFMNSFCFTTWDLDSREFISDRFGKNYATLDLHAMNRPVPVQREGHVVEDWDILNLRIGEAFINLHGEKPFKFRFKEYIKKNTK